MSAALKKFNRNLIVSILPELELKSKLQNALEQLNDENEVLAYLTEHQQFNAMVYFLALGLPKREAVWWAYLCAFAVEGKSQCEKTIQAFKYAHDWVLAQSDGARRAAGVIAEALELYTPASWVAMAAFWSGDNIAPIGKPNVEPDQLMTGQAVFNAIHLAAEQNENSQQAVKHYLKKGLHIAMGGNGKIETSVKNM